MKKKLNKKNKNNKQKVTADGLTVFQMLQLRILHPICNDKKKSKYLLPQNMIIWIILILTTTQVFMILEILVKKMVAKKVFTKARMRLMNKQQLLLMRILHLFIRKRRRII